jgi:deoxyadenosine/deoxycytidine kinase
VASGPIHALCMMMGATGSDMSPVLARITPAAVYVRLEADAEVVTRRLAGRLGQLETDLSTHEAWMRRYEEASMRIFERLDRPVIDVRADGAPDQVAEEIAVLVRPFLDERPGVQG